MLELFLISSVFTLLGYFKPRAWALVVPFVVWLAIARLGDLGILSAKTTTDAAILAGGVGAAFALLGFFLSAGRPRPTTATGTAAESPGSRRNDAPHGGATTVESTAVPQPAGGGSETSPGAAPQPAVPRTSRPRSTKAG